MEVEGTKKPKKGPKVAKKQETVETGQAGEEELLDMLYDSNAYDMLHRAKVEWPCLSVDFLLPERWGQPSSFK